MRGFTCLNGNASSEELLRIAGIERAGTAIVSVRRDDTAVLVVLTIRALAKDVRIEAGDRVLAIDSAATLRATQA